MSPSGLVTLNDMKAKQEALVKEREKQLAKKEQSKELQLWVVTAPLTHTHTVVLVIHKDKEIKEISPDTVHAVCYSCRDTQLIIILFMLGTLKVCPLRKQI